MALAVARRSRIQPGSERPAAFLVVGFVDAAAGGGSAAAAVDADGVLAWEAAAAGGVEGEVGLEVAVPAQGAVDAVAAGGAESERGPAQEDGVVQGGAGDVLDEVGAAPCLEGLAGGSDEVGVGFGVGGDQ